MKRILIMKTGSTFPSVSARRGDFEVWIEHGLALGEGSCETICVAEGESLPAPDSCAGVIITGSSAMVSEREAWSEESAAWLAEAVRGDLFVLGICYGHQLIAHALGGRVGVNPKGRQIGTVRVKHAGSADPLFRGLPEELIVQATHVESVLELPDGAVRLGWNESDSNHAFRIGQRVWGVQFHPEFDADIMRSYIGERSELISGEGGDPGALLAACEDSPHGGSLLTRFGEMALAAQG